MERNIDISRRTVLASVGTIGASTQLAQGYKSQGSATTESNFKQRSHTGIDYDVKISNHTTEAITLSGEFIHKQSSRGPQETFTLGSRYDEATPDHTHIISKLPDFGGKYAIRLESNEGVSASNTLKMSKERVHSAIYVSVKNSGIHISTIEE